MATKWIIYNTLRIIGYVTSFFSRIIGYVTLLVRTDSPHVPLSLFSVLNALVFFEVSQLVAIMYLSDIHLFLVSISPHHHQVFIYLSFNMLDCFWV